jgi:hypothetical protein
MNTIPCDTLILLSIFFNIIFINCLFSIKEKIKNLSITNSFAKANEGNNHEC